MFSLLWIAILHWSGNLCDDWLAKFSKITTYTVFLTELYNHDWMPSLSLVADDSLRKPYSSEYSMMYSSTGHTEIKQDKVRYNLKISWHFTYYRLSPPQKKKKKKKKIITGILVLQFMKVILDYETSPIWSSSHEEMGIFVSMPWEPLFHLLSQGCSWDPHEWI